MSTLAQHKHHLNALGEIRDIMAALKNISLTEGQRLRRFLESQQRVINGIEQAMTDFLTHYPNVLPDNTVDDEILIMIGSERGFCGDFNETLLAQLTPGSPQPRALLAVGEKLCAKLDEARIAAESLTGPTTVEDVPEVLLTVVDKLQEIHARHGMARLSILYHHFDGHTVEVRRRQPFRDVDTQGPQQGYPPLLNVAPQPFLQALLDHYLFAVLHGMFYGSLAAEHQLRLQHLQGAMDHIDHQSADLTRHYNALRQELITEEIELILLSAGPHLQES